MTEQRNDRKDKLDALYREAGGVEPEAGLDRIIRARAEEAARSRRSANRMPWLGGLVTASVAIVAIAVVLQQAPSGDPVPESTIGQESGEPDAFMAPSMGADVELKPASENRRARTEKREMQSAGAGASEATAPPSTATLRAPAQTRIEERRAERLGDIVADQAAEVAEPDGAVSEVHTEGPVTVLARIEALLEQDQIQPARELLEAFRREYPDHAIPEKIQETLAPPE